MFNYYGGKSRIVKLYPAPKQGKIIEPFAGSARYSLRYFENDVLLVDKYEVVVEIWKWLQQCSKQDILSLPKIKRGEDLRQLNISREEKMFLGMMAGVASTTPRHKVSFFSAEQNGRKNKFRNIADQLFKIKHWEIKLADYTEIENFKATWFIDPPYQHGGHAYKVSKIDFNSLSYWCQERLGQVIVCENTKANWLPFSPLTELRGSMNTTTEAIWCNEHTSYKTVQTKLFQND